MDVVRINARRIFPGCSGWGNIAAAIVDMFEIQGVNKTWEVPSIG